MTTAPLSPVSVSLGKLAAGHGVRGRARIRPFHGDGGALLGCTHVWLEHERTSRRERFRVLARQRHGEQLLMELEGIDSLTALEPWIGAMVSLEESELPPLRPDEFYQYRAIGLEVSTVDGRVLGRVAEVLTTPANDVWVIRPVRADGSEVAPEPPAAQPAGKPAGRAKRKAKPAAPVEYLVPVVGQIVEEIDLAARTARIRPIPGLLED